jgi:IS1 family transposase
MNKLSLSDRAKILRILVEGTSLLSAARIAHVSRNTVYKLLCDVGTACLDFQDLELKNLPCRRIQCEEIWSFVYSNGKDEAGEAWTWTAIDTETKLVPCWHVGNRSLENAEIFIKDLASRLANPVQLVTDGHRPSLEAIEIERSFGGDIDYARLTEMYGTNDRRNPEKSYSQKKIIESKTVTVSPGKMQNVTKYGKRQNLTMRKSICRFAGLTTGNSKKIENHLHAISLHYMYYNFGRTHETLRVTPAMKAGIADHVWSLEEIADLAPHVPPKNHFL